METKRRVRIILLASLAAALAFGFALGATPRARASDGSAAVAAGGIPESPWFDKDCVLTPADREARRQFAVGQLSKIDHQLEVLKSSLQTVSGAMSSMNHVYLASDIIGVGSSALLFASGYESLVLALKAAQVTIFAGTAISTTVSFSKSFYGLAHGYHIQEGQLDWSLRHQIEELLSRPIKIDTAQSFLAAAKCGKNDCPTDQPQIEQLISDLNSWHEDAAKRNVDNDGLLEAWSNTYGKLLGAADLPWLDALTVVVELKRNYYLTLQRILEHDATSCTL